VIAAAVIVEGVVPPLAPGAPRSGGVAGRAGYCGGVVPLAQHQGALPGPVPHSYPNEPSYPSYPNDANDPNDPNDLQCRGSS
jgi:hypothetical protein